MYFIDFQLESLIENFFDFKNILFSFQFQVELFNAVLILKQFYKQFINVHKLINYNLRVEYI